jgi:hypothetical protein
MTIARAGKLLDVIDSLDELDDDDPYNPLAIYAPEGPDSREDDRAVVCAGDEEGTLTCPEDHDLSEVLGVSTAREAIEVWSEWRGGRTPTPRDKFAAVMYYSSHDAFLPVTDESHPS